MKMTSPLFPSSASHGQQSQAAFVGHGLKAPQFGSSLGRMDSADSFLNSPPDVPPILQALQSDDFNRLKTLVAQGADVNEEQEEDGATPLLVAAEQNKLKAASFLIESGANINKGDSYNRTPLMVAALEGHYHMAQLLLSADALVHLKDDYGETALSYAVFNGSNQLAQLLLSWDDPSFFMTSSKLLELATQAAQKEMPGLLKELLNLPALHSVFRPLMSTDHQQINRLPNLHQEPNHPICKYLRKNGFRAFFNKPLGK